MRGLMRDRVGWAIGMLAVAAVICSGPGWASSRVALVVGNGAYTAGNISALANPVNDAELMADALETSGFEVQLVTDADQAAMRASIEDFGERLEQAGGESVGLFYYAGHGVEVRGHNYLIPIGAEIEREVEFMTDAVPADWVMSWMGEVGNRLNIVILDACRNNPYEGRHRGASQGLAQMNAPTGTLIAYSAAPKQVAEDGEGDNSPYTASLAKTLVEPGLKIEDVFKRVRKSVEEVTNGRQTPWESSSLRGDFYFMAQAEEPPAPEPSTVTVTETVSPELTVQQLAARAYEAAERIHTVSSYRLVIEQFPGTLYAGLAEQQIEKLESATITPARSPEEDEASLHLERKARERIQIGLWSLGFNPGSPDGRFGQRTRKAIREWQAARGEKATGYLDAASAKSLADAAPDVSSPIWLTAQNQPCKVWNPKPEPGEVLTWSGGCVAGKASGAGYMVWRGNYGESIYEGEYRNGKRHGLGSWVQEEGGHRYEGKWHDGKRHGQGLSTWADGTRYEGEYRDGKRHGRGTRTWEGTDEFAGRQGRYDGDFRNGKFHGRGALVWPSGRRYEGEFRDGWRNGTGTCTSAEQQFGDTVHTRRYTGGWREGKAHGRGTIIQFERNTELDIVSLERYEGAFRDGEPHGRGTESSARIDDTDDWTSYEGEWRISYEGEYHHGKAIGRWTNYMFGNRYEGEWRDGEAHGEGAGAAVAMILYRNGPPTFKLPYRSVC